MVNDIAYVPNVKRVQNISYNFSGRDIRNMTSQCQLETHTVLPTWITQNAREPVKFAKILTDCAT